MDCVEVGRHYLLNILRGRLVAALTLIRIEAIETWIGRNSQGAVRL